MAVRKLNGVRKLNPETVNNAINTSQATVKHPAAQTARNSADD
jgi:hypothetical protein